MAATLDELRPAGASKNQDRCERCGRFVRACSLVYDEETDQGICLSCEAVPYRALRGDERRDTVTVVEVSRG